MAIREKRFAMAEVSRIVGIFVVDGLTKRNKASVVESFTKFIVPPNPAMKEPSEKYMFLTSLLAPYLRQLRSLFITGHGRMPHELRERLLTATNGNVKHTPTPLSRNVVARSMFFAMVVTM